MYPQTIREPVLIGSGRFMEQREADVGRVSLAAYLLLAGPLFIEGVTVSEEDAEADRDAAIPPQDDLEQMGINHAEIRRVSRSSLDFMRVEEAAALMTLEDLARFATEVNASGNPEQAAMMVAAGTRVSDELIRVCALGSAVEFFDLETLGLPDQISWFLRNARQMQTFELLATLLARVWSPSVRAAAAVPRVSPPVPPLAQTARSGLLAVHGTVLPLTQRNRPRWSVPPHGSLFRHLKRIRADLYARPDYFRWEGGYTDYAREVAMDSLVDWLHRRNLQGVDVVAHSHGCNVVIGSAARGADYRKIILLSCPVHWSKYWLSPPAPDVVSVRIRVDLVILMDRGRQKFPRIPNINITERILPLWYAGHSATTRPSTWKREALDSYL